MTGEFGPPGQESPLTAGVGSSVSFSFSIELCESSPQLKHQKVQTRQAGNNKKAGLPQNGLGIS
jgi:hypothetical protein